MANAYFYSSTAVQTTLSVPITSGTLTFQVGDTTGWPVSYPYVAALDYGAAGEELVKVTGNTLSVLTVTRAFNGTSAASHSTGAVVRHVYCAQDATDFRTHEAASTGVHGLAGAVVGTSDAQSLSNKTYNGGALSGTFTGGPTFSGSPIFSGTTTFNAAATFAAAANLNGGGALAGTFTGAPTLSGAVVLSGAPNISNGAALAGTFSGTPTFSGAVAFSAAATVTRAATTNPAYNTKVTGDTANRWSTRADGMQSWGDGTVVDVNLYRLNATTLATDSGLQVLGSFTAGNYQSGAWPTYTPTLTASSVNPTLGSGSSQQGSYAQFGKLVVFQATITFGSSGTAAGTGSYRVSLPVAARTSGSSQFFDCQLSISGGTPSTVKAQSDPTFVDSTHIAMLYLAVSGTQVGYGSVSATTPSAWTANSAIRVSGFYEAA